MENQYNEKNTMRLVESWDGVAPSTSIDVSIATNTRAILVQNVLLAQISESLAILANNTRLIQEKESK